MVEATDWLKKNPRMNVWRSSRFFRQDMDGSPMADDQKSKNDALLVSHMPRRSNIPKEKLKHLDFKFAVLLSKKSEIKNPVCRASQAPKFVVPQVSVSHPAMHTRSTERNGVEKRGLVKAIERPSASNRTGSANANSKNRLKSNSKAAQSTPMILGKFNQHNVKDSADLSPLSQSKVVNQSTPNEAAVLRSILKEKRNSGRKCSRNVFDGKKSTAVKRVNFNGNFDDIAEEKENEESEIGVGSIVDAEESTAVRSTPLLKKKENTKIECEEEFAGAFSNFVKPLFDEEAEENNGNEEKVVGTGEKSSGPGKVLVSADEIHSKNTKSGFSGKYISGLVDLWKVYHSKVNHIRTELQLIDVNFQETLQLIMNNEIEEKLSAYEEQKTKLYQRLKDLELEFRENVRNEIDVKTLFSNYVKRKKNILRAQYEVEENFEKMVHTIANKYKGESEFDVEETPKESENVEIAEESLLNAKKMVKRASGAKRKSGCRSGVKRESTPRKRSSWDVKTREGSSPKRKKLSRKMQEQLRNLLEE